MDIESRIIELKESLTQTKEFRDLYTQRQLVQYVQKHREMLEECEKTRDREMFEELMKVPELEAYFRAERAFGALMGNAMQLLHELIYEAICN